MGNHLSGIVPVQLHSIEYYISDIAATECVTFDGNLGSTRFFKVARVKLHQVRPQASEMQSSMSNQYSGLGAPSLGVAKVFVINDPTLPLKAHKEMIDWVKEILKDNPNALAFSKAVINEKTAVLIRQYIKYNLYDRISTRPFLTFFEKTWVAYQILKSAEWIHEKGICHGDIKLENILITSYLWVLLTDFATYKPVFLPEDNPADFSYFFDTSRRRTCNVAPERFTHESYSQGDLTPPEYVQSSTQESSTSIDHQPSMDLFSIGCVLAELFTEVSSNGGLFDLSTLLSYRAGDRNLPSYHKIIDSIPDEQIRQTVMNLTELDPKCRKSASHHLKALTATLFPNYFSDLFIFIKDIIKLPPDEKVTQIDNKLKIISPLIKKEDPKGFLLLIVLVTSIIRSLKHVHAKIIGLELLVKILKCDLETLSPYILDRILPYLLVMLHDPVPRVRVEAINSLAFCLSEVDQVPPSDNNVFPDYILPNLTQLAKDPSVFVRMTLARHLAEFADTASKFLTNSSRDLFHYNTELTALHTSFQIMVSNLLTDPSSSVKIWILEKKIYKLCKFFGHQKTNELILSHIFTFLNGTEGHELRIAFFDNVVPIAEYLGSPCLELLKPFLQQGLADVEETVIARTLLCLSQLTIAKLWQKPIVFEILSDAVCLLSHPNIWIRHSLVYFIHLLAGELSSADIYCKVLPLVSPYLTKEIYSLENVDIVLENLKNSIPRQVLNMIIQPSRYTNLKDSSFIPLIDCLKERKRLRSKARTGKQSANDYTCPLLKSLNNQGESKLTEDQEEQILNLSKILAKIHRDFRGRPEPDPTANIITIRKPRKTYAINLYETDKSDLASRRNYQTASGINMNDEWQSMFGSHRDSAETSQEILDINSVNEKSTDLDVIPVAQEAKENNLNGNGPQLTTCPPCVNDLHDLISHKKHYFIYNVAEMTNSTAEPRYDSKHGQASHAPRGTLLGQLHEHTGCVNRMALIEPSTVFVTCSSDCTLKVWDAAKVEDRNCMINKSKQSFRVSDDESAFKTVVYAQGTNNLLSFTKSNTLYVLQIDNASSKMKLNRKVKQYCCNEPNTWLTDLCVVSPNVFAASNTASEIVGRDLRQPLNQAPAWKINEPLVKGMITALDGNEHVLCVGTSRGVLTIYDLRFYLEASVMNFGKDKKSGKRVMRILFSKGILYSAIQGNNEVILWNCGTSERIRSLWASDLPALTADDKDLNARSVNGIIVLDINGNECVVTGGTDFKLRFWDCANINNSSLISDSGKSVPWPYSSSFRNAPSEYTIHYQVKVIEGVDVIQEHKAYRNPSMNSLDTSFPHSSSSSSLNSGSNNPNGIIWEQQAVSSCHRSSITDLLWMNKMNALVSSSADGCVKVWR